MTDLPGRSALLDQDAAVKTFVAALRSNRLAGAYLLHGPDGVGRALGARLLAAAALCSDPDGVEPCRRCRSCGWNAAGTHPDMLVVSGETGPFFRDDGEAGRARADQFTVAARRAAKQTGTRRRIQVRTLRRLLELLSLAAVGCGRKVAILDSMDDVEEEGAATLLKTLEEAPRDTVFLLLATGIERIPDTILSRCQRLRFRPLPPATVDRLLLRDGGEEAAALARSDRERLVRLSQGSAGRALRSLLDGVHQEATDAARGLLAGGGQPQADHALVWVRGAGRELAAQRARLRELLALVLLELRDGAARGEGGEVLETLVPAVRGALESVEANVTPELVLRGLYARSARSLS